jgi:hypothetical protein
MSYYKNDCCPNDGYCAALIRGLAGVNGVNNTSFKATPVGTLQLLFDPENRQEASYDLQPDGYSVRKIRVKRLQRFTEADALDSITCNESGTVPYVEQCIDVTKQASVNFESTLEEMQAYCEAESAIVSGNASAESINFFNAHLQKIMAAMNGLREKINSIVITEILANIGINVSTGTNAPFSLDMIDSITGGKYEKGIQLLNHQMIENEVYGTYLISGFGVFDRFNTSMQFGCCNSWGLDWDAMSSAAPYRYYKDLKLKDLTGNPDIFLAFAPGAVQFVYYNDTMLHKLDNGRHGATRYGRIVDPLVPGIIYDVAIDELNCRDGRRAPYWNISLFLNFDVAFIPDNAFKAGQDRLHPAAGMSNGVFQYLAVAV